MADLYDIALAAVSVMSLGIALIGLMHEYRDIRIRRFGMESRSLVSNRSEYSEIMLTRRRENGTGGTPGSYLISSDEWVAETPDRDGVAFAISAGGTVKRLSCGTVQGSGETAPLRLRWRILGCRIHAFPVLLRPSYSRNSSRFLGTVLFNGDILSVADIETAADSRKPTVICRSSKYYRFYDTCQFLAFLTAYTANRLSDDEEKRDGILDTISLDPFDYGNRVTSIGVNALTLFHHIRGGPYFLVHRRSPDLAEAAGMDSLVPAGSLRPPHGSDPGDLLLSNVIREFLEEVLGHREYEDPESFWPDPDPDKGNYDAGSMEVRYCTMGMDPLSLKLEVVALLTIDCSRSSFKAFLKRMMPFAQFSNGPVTDLADLYVPIGSSSFEGAIRLERFDEENLKRLMHDRRSMPVMRECMRYMFVHRKEIEGILSGQEGIRCTAYPSSRTPRT